jgi:hypothetical protein
MGNENFHKTTEELLVGEAKQKAAIGRMGDMIAENEGYEDLFGMEAVYRYLIDKYKWLPHEVRGLSVDDLNMLLDGYGTSSR